MKIKTNELTGAALDWAVAKCEGFLCDYNYSGALALYSTDWSQGGPIIERERLLTRPQPGNGWESWGHGKDDPWFSTGPTPLIAAMRCYVASKLGDKVDVPEELQ
jgi:Protein of unknown function (DUF2591)